MNALILKTEETWRSRMNYCWWKQTMEFWNVNYMANLSMGLEICYNNTLEVFKIVVNSIVQVQLHKTQTEKKN